MQLINKNIFDGEWHGMVHCCNLYHAFGAGIAKQIKIKYPGAYEADCESMYGDNLKLGFSGIVIFNNDDNTSNDNFS